MLEPVPLHTSNAPGTPRAMQENERSLAEKQRDANYGTISPPVMKAAVRP